MEVTLALAYLGMALTVTAFALEVRGVVSSRAAFYLGAMLLGQTLLGLRAWVTEEWPFAILAAIWGGVALVGIVRPVTEGDDASE